MNRICIFAKNSTICQKLLPKIKNFKAFDHNEFDVENLQHIDQFNFSDYDTVINFAGHGKGNYRSPLNNSVKNYISQIEVNYLSHVLIAKKFISCNQSGRYIWISSILADACRPFQTVYGASKRATEYVFENWSKEFLDFKFVTLRIGRTKTNHLYNTFEHSKPKQETDAEYEESPYLDAQIVADKIFQLIEVNTTHTEQMLP